MKTQLPSAQKSANDFTQRTVKLGQPFSAPKSLQPVRLNLRELVPNFSNLLKDLEIGSLIPGLGVYPSAVGLAKAIADKYGLAENNVVVTAGGDDALSQITQAMIEPGRNLVVTVPTFVMIPRYVILAGGEIRTTTWLDGEFPLDDFLQLIDDNTRIVMFISPNNPTGRSIPLSVMQAVREKSPQAVLVLDAVYLEYSDQDITSDFLAMPQTLAIRSFSKAYGVPGLRIGYALSRDINIINAMKTVGQPYSVALPAIRLAQALLLPENETKFKVARKTVKQNAYLLMQTLHELNIDYLPSDANFVFLRFSSVENSMQLYDRLAGQGIFVRSFEKDPFINTCLCIGVPYEQDEVQFLIAALQSSNDGALR